MNRAEAPQADMALINLVMRFRLQDRRSSFNFVHWYTEFSILKMRALAKSMKYEVRSKLISVFNS
jgi:hypothetical protein